MKKESSDTYTITIDGINYRIGYESVSELKRQPKTLIDPDGNEFNRRGFWTIYSEDDIWICNVWNRNQSHQAIKRTA